MKGHPLQRMLVLSVVIMVMVSGCNVLKRPLNDNERFYDAIIQTEEEVVVDNWQGAQESSVKAKEAWARIKKRLQYNAGMDDVNDMDNGLHRLGAYIKVEDKGEALAEIEGVKEIWGRF